jgi:hypothetical protein
MSAHNSLVATYRNRHLAEVDIRKLQNAGVALSRLSVVIANRPGAMDGVTVVDSFGALDESLYRCIPEQDLVDYESELHAGRVILIAHGTPEEIDKAHRIAEEIHPESWEGAADSSVYYGCPD